METTGSPKTFFGRYDDALFSLKMIADTTRSPAHRAYAQELSALLTERRSDIIRDFLERCRRQGTFRRVGQELLAASYDLPSELRRDLEAQLRVTRPPLEKTPVSGEYIYCRLSFGGGKTYYYKTADPSLQCGDDVVVPVGNDGRTAIATIESIEIFPAGETPYPPHRTKDILGKCPD